MEKEALIRYACVTSPGMDLDGLAFPYLVAIDGTGLGVRIMPIGVALFSVPPWNQVPHVFMSALKVRYINVVCAPPGLHLGAPITVAQFGNKKDQREESVYQPELAITGLFTIGIPNVVILAGTGEFETKELEFLKHYTAIICPSKEGTKALNSLGIQAVTIPPDSDQLSRLFSGMTPA